MSYSKFFEPVSTYLRHIECLFGELVASRVWQCVSQCTAGTIDASKVDDMESSLFQAFKHLNKKMKEVATSKAHGYDIIIKALRICGDIRPVHAIQLLSFIQVLYIQCDRVDMSLQGVDMPAFRAIFNSCAEFQTPVDDAEWKSLYKFYQTMVVAVALSSNPKKGNLVAAAAMLSDGKFFVPGNGKSAATKRREKIFEVVSGKVSKTAEERYTNTNRGKRTSSDFEENTSCKRKKTVVGTEMDFDAWSAASGVTSCESSPSHDISSYVTVEDGLSCDDFAELSDILSAEDDEISVVSGVTEPSCASPASLNVLDDSSLVEFDDLLLDLDEVSMDELLLTVY